MRIYVQVETRANEWVSEGRYQDIITVQFSKQKAMTHYQQSPLTRLFLIQFVNIAQ